MKLKFKNQEFQTEAVNAVADLFTGQEKSNMTFSIDDNGGQIKLLQNDFGFGNKLEINNDTLLANMHSIQRRNKLPLSRDYDSRQFSIEMETGTGKTYVYTKTILELNQRYGFSKFIIVVPSVAIREGVFKSLQVTEEHFKNLYDGIPYRYFIYNSSKLSDVRRFATSSNIEIMIINIDAFKKAENIINQEQDKLNGETAMRYIQDTNPVGVLQLSALMDLTYEEKVEIEHQMDEASAFDVYEALVANDVIDERGVLRVESEIDNFELPKIEEPLKQEIKKILKQQEPVTFEKLKDVKCVETRIEEKTFSHEQASEIMEELKEMKVISKEGKIKDTMKAQLKAGKLDLSERYTKAAQRAIMQALEKADNRPVIRDANKEVTVRLKKQAILSPEFKELWDKIKQKTTYRVNIDTDTLIKNCVKELREMPPIPKAKLLTSTAEIEIENAGVYSTEKHTQTTDLENTYSYVPDILRLIASETLLKHSTIIQILKQSGREQDFMNNPQLFYEKALEIILRNRHSLAIDGIKYIKLAGEEYYVQEIFDSEELLANLDRNAVQVEHSVYDYLIYDSGVESRFAKSLDEDPDVKMFFKIPPRFKIETPIGSYNPDWAVFLEKDGEQKLYFVLETKGTTSLFDLRNSEKLKIHCGKQHFAALEDGIEFSEEPVKDWKEFKVNI